jgi:hypothetical protein
MFEFLASNFLTGHNAANTTGLSPRLWNRVLGTPMPPDGSKRPYFVGDDFSTVQNSGTYTDIFGERNYVGYIDTGSTITGMADEKGGAIALNGDAGDEDEVWISGGDGTQQLGQISDTAGDAHLTAFECRLKLSSIVDGAISFFAGLASPGLAAADTLTDATGAPAAAKAFIGFRNLLDGDNIAAFYQAASQTLQTSVAAAHTLVADTYVKLGFVYDPNAVAARRIAWYVNNVELSTYVTAAQIAAATFPDAEPLQFLFGYKNTVGTTPASTEAAMDWWAFGQLI